jgi:hypothetical protein
MSLDRADVYYYMSEAVAAQGPECHMAQPADGLLCASVPTSIFAGPEFGSVVPIPSFEDQFALWLWVIQRAADIASLSVFLETVRDTSEAVVAYRVWIPLDGIALLEYQRVAADSVETPEERKRKRAVIIEPPPRATAASITTLKRIGDTLRGIFPDVSFGQGGTLTLEVGGDNSLFGLLSAERVLGNSPSDTKPCHLGVARYTADAMFQCPVDLLASGDIRSLRFVGHGISSADDLRNWARPEFRPSERVVRAHLTGLLRASGNFSASATVASLHDMMPTEFPEANRPPYDGPVFKTALAFYAPIAVPIVDEDSQSLRSKSISFHI